MTRKRWMSSLLTLFFLTSATIAHADSPFVETSAVAMRLELEVSPSTCMEHQNFPLTIRIINPNDFAVIIPGFKWEYYVEPKIYLLQEEEEDLLLRYQATVSPWTKSPITIAPGGVLEKKRFLWNDNLATLWWPSDAGVYHLQAQLNTQARLEDDDQWYPIAWQRPVVEMRVERASPSDRRAFTWLAGRLEQHSNAKAFPGTPRNVHLEKVRIFEQFLSRYPESSYAPSIRWETGKLLVDLLGNEGIQESDLPQMVELLDDCLSFCLDRGGAFADDFTKWDQKSAWSAVMELAFMHGRHQLLGRVAAKIDERFPRDEAGIMFRRILVTGVLESQSDASRQGEELRRRFPNSTYAKKVPSLLRQLAKHSIEKAG